MIEPTRIEVERQDGTVVRAIRYRELVTLQSSDENEPLRYIAMSWKGRHAHWARRHLATPARKHYTLVCYRDRIGEGSRREIGRYRVQFCHTYRLKKKLGGGLYATMVVVAEDQIEKLQRVAGRKDDDLT